METTQHPNDLPENLRVADLVAKTSRVMLKNTIRVALAIAAVDAQYGGGTITRILLAADAKRPSPENTAACEQAYFDLQEGSVVDREAVDRLLAMLRELP